MCCSLQPTWPRQPVYFALREYLVTSSRCGLRVASEAPCHKKWPVYSCKLRRPCVAHTACSYHIGKVICQASLSRISLFSGLCAFLIRISDLPVQGWKSGGSGLCRCQGPDVHRLRRHAPIGLLHGKFTAFLPHLQERLQQAALGGSHAVRAGGGGGRRRALPPAAASGGVPSAASASDRAGSLVQ